MVLVVDATTHGSWDIQFRRNFGPLEETQWAEMRDSLPLPLSLSDTPDQVAWAISPSGSFTVRSAYRALFSGPDLSWTPPLRKAPLPLRIKFFVWQLLCDRLPSGTEVALRHGPDRKSVV